MSVKLINKKYGGSFKEHLLDQYKLLAESADKITERRQNTNKFYLGINSLFLGFSGYLTAIDNNIVIVLIALIGFLISIVWNQNINSFKKLNSAKFKVIHELEKQLPASIYTKENEYLKKSYYKLTSIEKWIPKIFAIIYLIIIGLILFNLF